MLCFLLSLPVAEEIYLFEMFPCWLKRNFSLLDILLVFRLKLNGSPWFVTERHMAEDLLGEGGLKENRRS